MGDVQASAMKADCIRSVRRRTPSPPDVGPSGSHGPHPERWHPAAMTGGSGPLPRNRARSQASLLRGKRATIYVGAHEESGTAGGAARKPECTASH
jgi:hypothetical protein